MFGIDVGKKVKMEKAVAFHEYENIQNLCVTGCIALVRCSYLKIINTLNKCKGAVIFLSFVS